MATNTTNSSVADCSSPDLEDWQIALTVIGGLALLVAIAVTTPIFVRSCYCCLKKKHSSESDKSTCRYRSGYRWYSGFYYAVFGLDTSAAANALGWWIGLGVTAANPPNGDQCDSDWRNSVERAVIIAFCCSIAAFILSIALVVLWFSYPKCVKKTETTPWNEMESCKK